MFNEEVSRPMRTDGTDGTDGPDADALRNGLPLRNEPNDGARNELDGQR